MKLKVCIKLDGQHLVLLTSVVKSCNTFSYAAMLLSQELMLLKLRSHAVTLLMPHLQVPIALLEGLDHRYIVENHKLAQVCDL